MRSQSEVQKDYDEAIGFGFSPVPMNGKIPKFPGWTEEPQSYFGARIPYHNGNLALRTGIKSGVIILDCDKPREGSKSSDGNIDLQRIFEKEGLGRTEDMKTISDISGSGSLRLYFEYDALVDYISKIKNTNIDVLGDKKLAVYPGSIYQGCCKPGEKKHKCGTKDECLYAGNKYKWHHSPSEYKALKLPECLKKYVTKPMRVVIERDDEEEDDDEKKLEDFNEAFEYLAIHRWEERESWISLIWLLCKLGADRGQIQKFSGKAENYDEASTDQIIDQYNHDRCNITIATLYHYLQEDVDIETYKRLTKIKESDRIASLVKYITSIGDFKTIEHKDKYVDHKIYEEKNKITLVKAGLGKGKSTSTSSYISNTEWYSIIVLTPRRTYAKAATNRLNRDTQYTFVDYQDSKGLIKDKFVVIQAESLNRLKIEKEERRLLIMDEAEAFMYQLTSASTHRDKHIDNIDSLLLLIEDSKKIIALDAFLSRRTVISFLKMGMKKEDITIHDYITPMEKRTAVEYRTRDGLLNKMLEYLDDNKKIIIVYTSATSMRYDKMDYKGNVRRGLLPTIERNFPDKKVTYYCGGNKPHKGSKLENVNEEWIDSDVVAYTSTVTVGINFDIPDVFDAVFVYANSPSKNNVRDIFQGTYRVRHLKERKMHFFIDPTVYGERYLTYYKSIKNKNERVSKLIKDVRLKYPGKVYLIDTPKFITYLVNVNYLENSLSVMHLQEMFYRYLELCNYEIIEEGDEMVFECIFDYEFETTIEYKDIKEVTASEFKELKKRKGSLTEMEKAQMKKYYFQFILLNREGVDEEKVWDLYTEFGYTKFRNISREKGYKNKYTTMENFIEFNSYNELDSGFVLKLAIVDRIVNFLGVEHSHDFMREIPREKLNVTLNVLEMERKDIHTVFKMRDGTKGPLNIKTGVSLINKVLSRWGFSKIKDTRKKKNRNGVIESVGGFKLINTLEKKGLDIYKELKPISK